MNRISLNRLVLKIASLKITTRFALLSVLIIATSAADLYSPPLSSTSWRQTQTATLTENLVKSDFSLNGMFVNFLGEQKPLMIYEFPLYNYVVGFLFRFFGYDPLWGKLISLVASILAMGILVKMVSDHYGATVSNVVGLFYVFTPINVLMRTSFQPDSVAMLFLLGSIYYLLQWKETHNALKFAGFSLFLSLATLVKFPIIVPFLLIIFLLFLRRENGVLKVPGMVEFLLLVILVAVPNLVWYLHFSRMSYGPFWEGANTLFLFGNLHRFVEISYYVKPAFIFIFYVFTLTGVVFFVIGIRAMKVQELAMVMGVPLYLFIVPTSADQHYYQFAITPITALLMGIGCVKMWEALKTRKLIKVVLFFSLFVYGSVFVTSVLYLLRQDRVFYGAGTMVRDHTMPNDQILSLVLHDRVYHHGGWYSEMMYMSNRRGWNLTYTAGNDSGLVGELEKRKKDAKYLIVTWYSEDLEPWFVHLIPAQFARNPGIDGRQLFDRLTARYQPISRGPNYGLLQLTDN